MGKFYIRYSLWWYDTIPYHTFVVVVPTTHTTIPCPYHTKTNDGSNVTRPSCHPILTVVDKNYFFVPPFLSFDGGTMY